MRIKKHLNAEKKRKTESELCAGVHGLCVFPADGGDSGKWETGAETELGWQRDEYRERNHRWEIDSGKKLVFIYFLTCLNPLLVIKILFHVH